MFAGVSWFLSLNTPDNGSILIIDDLSSLLDCEFVKILLQQ
jgi:hypothetical protein